MLKSPLNNLIKEIRDLLTKWKKSKFISEQTYKKIYRSDENLPGAYGLAKVHKPGVPFRIIISSLVFCTLVTFLHDIISKKCE